MGGPLIAAPFIAVRFAKPVVTRAVIPKLLPGSSLEQVTALIGAPGRGLTAEFDGRVLRETFVWSNPDGSTLHVTLENHGLASASAERLP